jgi:four helix bundle protein
MATEPPPFVTFKAKPETVQPVYQLALELSKQLFTIIELMEGVERFHLRDALDKKSTAISMIVARALGTQDMTHRRKLYRTAHESATECVAILDVLAQRGTVEPEPLEQARVTAGDLCSKLARLGDRWRELPYG